MSLQAQLEDIVKDANGTFGVYVKHLETGETASIYENRLFQAASTFKVPILSALYREAKKGTVNLDERVKLTEKDFVPGSGIFQRLTPGVEVTIKDLAMMMIIVSDNAGTDKILEIIGKETVDQFMKELGLTNIHTPLTCWELLCLCVDLEPRPYSPEFLADLNHRLENGKFNTDSIVFQESIHNNVSSPKDMAKLLELIVTKQLISEKACDEMFDILSKQQHRNRIPYLLPGNTVVAHKTGTVGSVINDVGIVKLPYQMGTYVITVFSTGNSSEAEGANIINKLSKAAYDYFLSKIAVGK
ncbi:serine hydrolase [Neobacillus terrae]|uniref:serine hydrolase n=1 Tax=Neobacillus terrae TaxID=3034837 RepID=UPI00140D20EC|nr:serine hydrolase [Neobacillus terrae]NHM31311.1 serine hydrolase [Neobacillus terrae]